MLCTQGCCCVALHHPDPVIYLQAFLVQRLVASSARDDDLADHPSTYHKTEKQTHANKQC